MHALVYMEDIKYANSVHRRGRKTKQRRTKTMIWFVDGKGSNGSNVV